MYIHTDTHRATQTSKQTDRQTDRQTDTYSQAKKRNKITDADGPTDIPTSQIHVSNRFTHETIYAERLCLGPQNSPSSSLH